MVKLQKISLLPLAKIVCTIQAVIGFIIGIIVTIGSLANGQEDGIWALGAWSLLILPLVNAFLGFLTGLLIAWLYNFLVPWIGGIEIETEKSGTQ